MSALDTPASPRPAEPALTPDISGRDRMVGNVLASWAGYFVVLCSGFILPRLIDRGLGQVQLGVWDFAWSLTGYFGLVQVGIVGSVNRYVARYRATGDAAAVNRAASSVTVVLAAMALVIAVLAALLAWVVLPAYAAAKLGPSLEMARWVVLLLGLEVAVQTLFSGYGGVLTGCHRWDLYNAIHAGAYGVIAAGMITVLFLGGGLPSVALVRLVGTLGMWLLVAFMAYQVAPGLRIQASLVSRAEARSMLNFGAKSFVPQMGELLLNQTVSVLILAYLGPAPLALFNRPRSLVQHVRTLVTKMAVVLIPSSGSLEAGGRMEEVQSLAIKSTRYAAFLALPVAAVLVVLGGPILAVWMGEGYRDDLLAAILGLGTVVIVLQVPVFSILVGLNRHGWPGRLHFITSVVTVICVWVGLAWFKAGLLATALGATVPLTLVYGFYMPVYAARCLGLPLFASFRQALAGPALATALFAACLGAARFIFRDNSLAALLAGCASGSAVLAPIYWRWALPGSLKSRIRSLLGFPAGAGAGEAPGRPKSTGVQV